MRDGLEKLNDKENSKSYDNNLERLAGTKKSLGQFASGSGCAGHCGFDSSAARRVGVARKPGKLLIFYDGKLMTHEDYLKANTTIFWLIALIAAGLIFIGIRFIVAPMVGANGFGVPVDGTQTFAYLWAKGTRDIVSGLLLLLILWLKVSRRGLAAFIFIASLTPIGDALNVYANVGTSNITALMIHSGTALFAIILAIILLRRR